MSTILHATAPSSPSRRQQTRHQSSVSAVYRPLPVFFAMCLEAVTADANDLGQSYRYAGYRHLPKTVREIVNSHQVPSADYLSFGRGLCHRCNMASPSRRYCREMYGTAFIQYYGWYVNQTYLRFGMLPDHTRCLADVTPTEFVDDLSRIKSARADLDLEWKWFRDRDEALRAQLCRDDRSYDADRIDYDENARHQDALRGAQTQRRRVERVLSTKIENIVRQELGFRRVGEGWASETLVFHIVRQLLPDVEILRHFRPPWLNGLELDIYVPSLHLAVEYQGQQHFHAIPAWGGAQALADQQERDARKANLCSGLGIRLVYVDYRDPLTRDFISFRLFGRREHRA